MVFNWFRQSGSIFGPENFKPFLQIYQPYSHILHPLQVDIPALLTFLHPLQVDIPALLTHPPSSTDRYTSSTHTSSILYR